MNNNFIIGALIIGAAAGLLTNSLVNPVIHSSAQVQNLFYVPAQFTPGSATLITVLAGIQNPPPTSTTDVHVCELMVMGPTAGTSATFTLSDNQSTAIKYFDAVTVLSSSAGSNARLIEAKGPEGCVYFKGGLKINASAGSQFYFTMKGYY